MDPRLVKAKRLCENNLWLQQFGQADDEYAWDGATACTHVCFQTIILLWKGRRYTIDQISKLAGYPYHARSSSGPIRGMNNTEAQRLINRLNLPYEIRFGLSASTLLAYAKRAPVIEAVRYGSEPDWRGYVYRGIRADGKPNGFARPDKKAGRTQLTGYENGRHANVILGSVRITSGGVFVRTDVYRKDPNHRSGSRPEKPPYDIIKSSQLTKEYTDYKNRLGNKLYAIVPIKSLPL